ncbi:MAG: hypothetical protein ACYC2U_04415 [Candidatus Amoebophilus sp.]
MIRNGNIYQLVYCRLFLYFFCLRAILAFTPVEDTSENLLTLGQHHQALKEAYSGVVESKNKQQAYYEQSFFQVFPNSLRNLDSIYFSQRQENYSFQNSKDDCIATLNLFNRLQYIDRAQYYGKCIDIAVGSTKGVYYVILDYYKRNLFEKVFYNTKDILVELAKRPEKEIVSFFEFLLKHSLPSHLINAKPYKKLYIKIKHISKKIACISSVKGLFETYIRMEQQLELLREYYEKAINSTGNERAKYEQLFFESYPSSSHILEEMYSYFDERNWQYSYNEKWKHLLFFENLTSIDKTTYFNKYIDLCSGAGWFSGLENKLLNDTEAFIAIFSERSDQEVKSIFHDLFNGAHPDNEFNWARYNQLYDKVNPVNTHIASLMKEAFEQVLSEEHCPGH